MSIVTKTGDKGITGLYGGMRISKADARMHAIGTVDELNAALGIVYAEHGITDEMKSALTTIQNHLFRLGADLATPLPGPESAKRIETSQVKYLESIIGGLEPSLPPLQWFILPSGSRTGALLHQARAVCRRAERWMVALGKEETNPEAIIYINRLSDLLFLLARAANRDAGTEETRVEY
jgi:cob(I)alamin adenosyltransferase